MTKEKYLEARDKLSRIQVEKEAVFDNYMKAKSGFKENTKLLERHSELEKQEEQVKVEMMKIRKQWKENDENK